MLGNGNRKAVETLMFRKEEGTPIRVRAAKRIKPRQELVDDKEPR